MLRYWEFSMTWKFQALVILSIKQMEVLWTVMLKRTIYRSYLLYASKHSLGFSIMQIIKNNRCVFHALAPRYPTFSFVMIVFFFSSVSHLLFCDDSIFFCKTESRECEKVMKLVRKYGKS